MKIDGLFDNICGDGAEKRQKRIKDILRFIELNNGLSVNTAIRIIERLSGLKKEKIKYILELLSDTGEIREWRGKIYIIKGER